MEWQNLDLSKASVVKREVDLAISTLKESTKNPEINKSNLISSIQFRIQQLEIFYVSNSDDDRAVLFEKERLRLRKAVQTVIALGKDTRHQSISNTTTSPENTPSNHLSRSFRTENTSKQNISNNLVKDDDISEGKERSVNGSINQSIMSESSRKLKNHMGKSNNMSNSNILYAWEEQKEKPPRGQIEVNDLIFQPMKKIGFYQREVEDSESISQAEDQQVDFYVVLNHEEITTLASRKKSTRSDNKLRKSNAAKTSVHSSTPYVDPRRITQSLLRDVKPEKWVNPDGMKPYKKSNIISF